VPGICSQAAEGDRRFKLLCALHDAFFFSTPNALFSLHFISSYLAIRTLQAVIRNTRRFFAGIIFLIGIFHPFSGNFTNCMGFLAVVAQTYTCPEKNLEGGSARPDAFIG
jgi:hypothetical protein